MRLNNMGANDSMVNMAGAGATSYGGAPQPGYAMAPSSSRASYNTLEMAGEQPMGHAASGAGGYHDQGVSTCVLLQQRLGDHADRNGETDSLPVCPCVW